MVMRNPMISIFALFSLLTAGCGNVMSEALFEGFDDVVCTTEANGVDCDTKVHFRVDRGADTPYRAYGIVDSPWGTEDFELAVDEHSASYSWTVSWTIDECDVDDVRLKASVGLLSEDDDEPRETDSGSETVDVSCP